MSMLIFYYNKVIRRHYFFKTLTIILTCFMTDLVWDAINGHYNAMAKNIL